MTPEMKILSMVVYVMLASIGGGEVRLNQIQVIGTHNSYHLAPDPVMMKITSTFSKDAKAWEYSHAPIGKQLESGIRQIELDVFADPRGGLYAESGHPHLAEMKKPGIKVLHVPKLDFQTNHATFVSALEAVRDWSKENKNHVPVMILVELKDRREVPFGPVPVKFDRKQMDALEKEILVVFRKEHLLVPDQIRGGEKSLRDAVLKKGWPLLSEARGKVFFCLDNEGGHREVYLNGNESLQNRLLFVSVARDHPAAAFMKKNDPVRGFQEIRKLVEEGFVVRTRADANLKEGRANDFTRANKALASGAQYVSTDFPVADGKIGNYAVKLPLGAVARANPVSGAGLDAGKLE